MINVLRQVNEYQLYIHGLMNVYAVSDNNNTSLWFDNHTKNDLMMLNDDEFVQECEEMIDDD